MLSTTYNHLSIMHACNLEHKAWVFMAIIRRVIEETMSLAHAAREMQYRSQAIMPRLSGRAARRCTKIIESWKGRSLHAQEILLQQS
jgi:hypothetical protein